MKYELWSDQGGVSLVVAADLNARNQLGPCAERLDEFEADSYEEAKNIMVEKLYGESSSRPSTEVENLPQSWSNLSSFLESRIRGEEVDLLVSNIPSQCLGSPISVMTWISSQENHLAGEVRKCIELIGLSTSRFTDSNERVNQLVSIRLRAACDFVDGICKPPRCVIPYPKITFQALLEWLLIDWWGHVGLMDFSTKANHVRAGASNG
ncbi:MAG TPA: hypothetical protein VGE29_01900 [Prosthecobacter sp.]